jgi:predicted glycosyltransferase involved in capsule biosynthesis
MKTQLKDTTFLFALKPDSIIRIENVLEVIRYIRANFDTCISVLEVSPYNNGFLKKLLNSEVRYSFIEDKDLIFHRTKYRNLMSKEVETPFLAVWDSDVIVDKTQIISALSKLRQREADIVYPYDGKFYDTSAIIRALYLKRKSIKTLHRHKEKMSLIYGERHKGGAFIANRERYIPLGMENENFYGWGPEDYERYERWINLNFKVANTEGCMYHLTHPRDINGNFNSQRQGLLTNAERTKAIKSSFDELYYPV